MAIVVVDASVAIAFLDATDRHHRRAVEAFTESQSAELVLPASAYAEILVAPSRRGAEAIDAVDRFVSSLAIRIEPLHASTARRAAALRAQHRSLRLPDALVLATAEALDAAIVLTADRAWRTISGRARVI